MLWYQDSVVPVRKFPVRVTYHFLSPKAPDEPLSFCPTTQLGGPWLPLKTFQLFFESLVTLPNLIFFFPPLLWNSGQVLYTGKKEERQEEVKKKLTRMCKALAFLLDLCRKYICQHMDLVSPLLNNAVVFNIRLLCCQIHTYKKWPIYY